jgi:sulfatase modifying factor 1
MGARVGLLGAIGFLVSFAGCAPAAPFSPGATWTVIIENPEHLSLVLFRVEDDDSQKIKELGAAERVQLDLPTGAYWVEAVQGGRSTRYPIPLFRKANIPSPPAIRVRKAPVEEPRMSYIPEGWSLQGDPLGIGQEDERPAHLAYLNAFWLSQYEVTNEEYAAFLNAVADRVDAGWLNLESRKCLIKQDAGTGRYATSAPRFPVVTVSWQGAQAYCDWLSRTRGRQFRLPTEAEWEKAARGPESFVFAYGNICAVRKANQESGRLVEVGRFAPNGYGLYDMTGNAFEWVQDAYDPAAYSARGKGDCRNPRVDGGKVEYRILRGGSFMLDSVFIRNSFRMRYSPTVHADDIGFRVAREE